MLLMSSLILVAFSQGKPKAVVSVKPHKHVFFGEHVGLRCDLQGEGDKQRTYSWYKNNNQLYTDRTKQDFKIWSVGDSDSGQYACRVHWSYSQSSEISDDVTLMVSAKPKPTLRVNPQSSIYTGDTVNLSCELPSAEWEFIWYKNNEQLQLMNSEQTNINILKVTIDNAEETVYQCRTRRRHYQKLYNTELSDPVKVTVRVRAKPIASINPVNQVFSGDTVTLRCDIQDESVSNWQYSWYKDAAHSPVSSEQLYRISGVEVTHTGNYTCRGAERGGSRTSHFSDAVTLTVSAKPKPTLRVNPQSSIYTGDTIMLSCELQSSGWDFHWYKDNQQLQLLNSKQTNMNTLTVTVKNAGETVYQCHAHRANYFYNTELSDPVKIKVRERPEAVLSVSPQSWLTEGDSVTLNCEVTDSSTNWTFSWYRETPYRDGLTQIKPNHDYIMYVELLSDSSRGSGGSYTLSSADLNHTGVYVCRGERGEPALHTQYSNLQTLWITGESPPVSLIINPSRTQHFTGDSLSLSCEDQSNSTGWTVRRYTHSERVLDCSWESVTGSTCEISSLNTSYTGVYWCESESGENSNPVNITVHDGDVILESPVHPVTQGHLLTLRCLDRNTKSSSLRVDFFKDGSVFQPQTTREMIIHNVTKSDEGFYHCKHPDRGESPKSWVLIRGVEAPFLVHMLICSLITASPYVLVTIILLLICCRD
ncbi:leukocyte immunoglobulin-like receptor subfamily A member 3 isoform 2-T2 [Clarias gariepinus]